MAITDPSAIQFSNTVIRPLADRMAQLYYTIKIAVDNWNSENWAALITNTTDIIQDGAPADGNRVITGVQATNIIAQAESFLSTFEANNNAVLTDILQVSVNP